MFLIKLQKISTKRNFMKLELVKKIGFRAPVLSAICIDENITAFFTRVKYNVIKFYGCLRMNVKLSI